MNEHYSPLLDAEVSEEFSIPGNNLENGSSEEPLAPETEPTVDSIDQSVSRFRDIVEIAWSKNTVYPDEATQDSQGVVDKNKLGRFNPRGQCAVTARLLVDELKDRFPEIKITPCLGKVTKANTDVLNNNHAWLEVELDGKTIIIDATPDQIPELQNDINAKTLVSPKELLEAHGYIYQPEKEDTDERMLESGSFGRYEILKKRYERTKEREDFYNNLLHSNVFIIAPVAAGKTELMNNLVETLPYKAIDMGKLFRMATFLILADTDNNAVNPDVQKIKDGDSQEENRIVGAISRRKKYIMEELLEKTIMGKNKDGRFTLFYEAINLEEDLQTPEVNDLVATVAKSSVVRETVWRWINKMANDSSGIILTGHSLSDIDTTKYRTINLEVTEEVAVKRLLEREGVNFSTDEEASESLHNRNESDHMPETQALLSQIKSVDTIDTSSLSPLQVKFRTIRRLAERARESVKNNEFQRENQVDREHFHWTVNPLLANIRIAGAEIIAEEEEKNKKFGITEFDLAVQTTIHLAAYEPKEVWQGNQSVLYEIQENVIMGNIDIASRQFSLAIDTGQIHLNKNLVSEVCARQSEKLRANIQNLFVTRDGRKLHLPASYMGNTEESPFNGSGRSEINTKAKQIIENPETGEVELIVSEKDTGRKITFRKVPHDISEMYAKGFHYLHEGRDDELSAFGAYLENDEFPFAWVSYSPTNREYKQEMLEYLGLEPHTVLELTRAWNSHWSPKNTMSTLFGYAHYTLQHEWEKKAKSGEVDKPLSGIVSAINGNLGFSGSTFSAANLKVVGFKPANFTYLKNEDGTTDYLPRRSIVKALGLQSTSDLVDNPRYVTNKFPLIPTNEMAIAFDKRIQDGISKKPIYQIPDDAYTTGS